MSGRLIRKSQPGDVAVLAGRIGKPRPTSKRLQVLHARFNGRCALCGGKTILGAPQGHPLQATVDHIIPRSRGGSNLQHNLQLACWQCNLEKADTVDAETIEKLVAERDQLRREMAELRLRTGEVVAKTIAIQRDEPVSGATLFELNAKWSEQRKRWAEAHAQFERENKMLKAALLAEPDGDLRFHLHCLERVLVKLTDASEREATVEGLRQAIEGLVRPHLEAGKRFREGRA